MVFAIFFLLLVLSSMFNCEPSGKTTSFDEEEMDMLSQCGSDEVAEPVYRLAYLRLGAPTHLASYQRSI